MSCLYKSEAHLEVVVNAQWVRCCAVNVFARTDRKDIGEAIQSSP